MLSRVSVLPNSAETQQLIVTWQNPSSRAIYPVAILARERQQYVFSYLKKVSEAKGFRPFAGFDDFSKVYTQERLFEFFGSRVLSAKRPDFSDYVEKLDLSFENATPWELLVRSTGKTKGDTIQLFPVPRDFQGVLKLPILIAGTRHLLSKKVAFGDGEDGMYTRSELEDLLNSLRSGQRLEIVREMDNSVSPVARLVLEAGGRPIGYLPEWIAAETNDLIDAGHVTLLVRRVNPPEMGWHLRVLAELVIDSDGYSMFNSSEWEFAGT